MVIHVQIQNEISPLLVQAFPLKKWLYNALVQHVQAVYGFYSSGKIQFIFLLSQVWWTWWTAGQAYCRKSFPRKRYGGLKLDRQVILNGLLYFRIKNDSA
jgi:hypothetical protein